MAGLEAVWAKVHTGSNKILTGAMYRPPNSDSQHWDLIDQSFEKAKLSGIQNIIIMGDKNEDQLKTN